MWCRVKAHLRRVALAVAITLTMAAVMDGSLECAWRTVWILAPRGDGKTVRTTTLQCEDRREEFILDVAAAGSPGTYCLWVMEQCGSAYVRLLVLKAWSSRTAFEAYRDSVQKVAQRLADDEDILVRAAAMSLLRDPAPIDSLLSSPMTQDERYHIYLGMYELNPSVATMTRIAGQLRSEDPKLRRLANKLLKLYAGIPIDYYEDGRLPDLAQGEAAFSRWTAWLRQHPENRR